MYIFENWISSQVFSHFLFGAEQSQNEKIHLGKYMKIYENIGICG